MSRGLRGAVTLIEVLITGACLLVASFVAMQMLSNNSTLTSWSRDALWVRERSSAVTSYWESFSFDTLEALFSGHPPKPEDLEGLLIPLEEGGLDPHALGLDEFREQQHFTRVMGMGILRSRLTWRGARGSLRRHDTLRLILEDRNFQPVSLPPTGAELLARIQPPGLDPRRIASTGSFGVTTDSPDSSGGRGSATSWIPGIGWQGQDQEGNRTEAARATADQLMEMLHDLHHSGEEQAQNQDLVRRTQGLVGVEGGEYDWGRLVGTKERAWSTDAAPRSNLHQLVEVLSARPPPDGDYLYTVQVEDDPSEDHQGRLLVLYRLVSLESGSEPSTYLLPKVVAQDGSGQDSTMERRPVLDLGDRELSLARLPGVADPVVLGAGEWAHVEVTLRRLYVYRQSYDQDAQRDPVDTVLSIRSFPESLIGDGERPQPGKELEQALAPLCQSLGVGDRSQDARGSGVDTRELLGW